MRHFEELPLEDGLALWNLLIEQGLVTEDHFVTPLGEEYIAAARGDEEETRKLTPLGDTEPIKGIAIDEQHLRGIWLDFQPMGIKGLEFPPPNQDSEGPTP